MRHAHFLVLTGRLNEFPLHELIETLRGQHKTGRLLVEFKAGPCALFFRDGALVEATLGSLRGLEALSLALSLQQEDSAPFNFNPLVAPPETRDAHPPADGGAAAAFARESAAQARAQVIEIEPEPRMPATGTHAGREDAEAPRLAAPESPPQLRAPEPRIGAHAETPTPRALLPPAEEGALAERLARIETAVAAQSRRANVERAVYAAVIAAVILATLLWRGRDEAATGSEGFLTAASAPAAAVQPSAAAPADGGNPTAADAQSKPAPNAEAAAAPIAQAGPSAQSDTAGATRPAPSPVKPGARPAGERAAQPSAVVPNSPAPGARQQAAASVNSVQAAASGNAAQPAASRREGRGGGHVVQVRMTVVRGRVLRAEVSNPRPGMSAYEALALRMARQRRYPEEFSGQETLRLSVGQ
ncbi:MAG TPA: DUF4388 domain-containing protein [Pyrinomonadaceae bacterium]|nr:DUF4388 domain-containing protein [Pyrinomonadaceae bacterium]